jgi:hypothetical protein
MATAVLLWLAPDAAAGGFTLLWDLQHPPDFEHFAYVDPAAPAWRRPICSTTGCWKRPPTSRSAHTAATALGTPLVYGDKFGRPEGVGPLERVAWLDTWWWEPETARRVEHGLAQQPRSSWRDWLPMSAGCWNIQILGTRSDRVLQ